MYLLIIEKKGFIMKSIILFLFLLPFNFLQAQWSPDPAVNNPICNAVDNQDLPQMISDGSGGAIITWQDSRSSNDGNIFAQRLDSSGIIRWALDGVAICSAIDNQGAPQIISDGYGGAIITWYDYRNGTSNPDIYAQRINSNGVILWSADGVVICNESNSQVSPKIINDSSGSAIITWIDSRNGPFNFDIFAQKINSAGIVQWTTNGVAICTSEGIQDFPEITSGTNGGAIIVWKDGRNVNDNNLFAQKVNSVGAVQWSVNGELICDVGGEQILSDIISDNNSGAFVTWYDYRNGPINADIYLQQIDGNGLVKFTTTGLAICSAIDFQWNPILANDGNNGAILTWQDHRVASIPDIYAQRINGNGIIQWAVDGVVVCSSSGGQYNPQLISDGNFGAIITWIDFRINNNANIYAQRINDSGLAQWENNGIAICTALATQNSQVLTLSSIGSAIISWSDNRNSFSDIYASRVFSDGSIPVEILSLDARVVDKTVELQWSTASETNNSGFNIERSNGSEFQDLGFVAGHGTTTETQDYNFLDDNVNTGKYSYRLKQIDFDGTYEYSNTIEVEIVTPDKFELSLNYPNPFNPSTKISWQSPVRSWQTLTVYDVLGNEIATLVNEEKPAGSYEVNFNASRLSSGIYFYKLQAGSFVETKKMILLK